MLQIHYLHGDCDSDRKQVATIGVCVLVCTLLFNDPIQYIIVTSSHIVRY